MKALRIFGVALVVVGLLGAAPPNTPLYGFTADSSARERQYESMFLDIPSAQGALDAAGTIAARPHYSGTPGDQQLAIYMRDTLRSYGFDAELETFNARVDTPHKLALQVIFNVPIETPTMTPTTAPRTRGRPARGRRNASPPGTRVLDLRESVSAGVEPVEGENMPAGGIGLPFNAGSADGNVLAPLVYASRGTDADYEELADHGIDPRGAVMLVRYGAEFRGTLAARAQRRGAVGVIFYNDPAEDGYGRGPAFPNGPWRAPTSVERGSVGDGIRIPTLPISANNAQILLAALRGPAGGRSWSGALPVSYPYARGPATVRLTVQLDRRVVTLWNTVGRIRGARGTQTVVLGAHRDAWVYGVGDNGSGVIALLEAARGFGYLLQNGWHPLRTLVVAGWDGEELGNLGSLAYVQRHRAELLEGGVAYLNADEVAIGPRFAADAAAALGPAINDATRAIADPINQRRSIYDEWAAEQRTALPFALAPGGGSDHASFLFDVGTPVANMAFTGPLGGYHSSDDTLPFALKHSDPGFVRHRTAAQLYGLLALRLLNADAVPYSFSAYVPLMRSALAQISAKATTAKLAIDVSALQSAIDAFAGTAGRFDALTARGVNVEAADRALEAARLLDRVAYGVDGYGASLFPELTRSLGAPNTAFDVAATRARNAIDQAGRLLGGAAGMAAPPASAPTSARRAPTRR
jgi:N-acetylated-alpha-linked acidic dipeptidase